MTAQDLSSFELQSLAVAQAQLHAYWAADGIAALALVAAAIAARVAFKSLRASELNTLLVLEQDMANRRTRFYDLDTELTGETGASSEMSKLKYNAAKESYFNAFDRLAASILRGNFPDRRMKLDYYDSITQVVRDFKEDFGTGTPFRNVLKLYDRWKDQV
jgi:hypothetical protein